MTLHSLFVYHRFLIDSSVGPLKCLAGDNMTTQLTCPPSSGGTHNLITHDNPIIESTKAIGNSRIFLINKILIIEDKLKFIGGIGN